MRYLFCVYSSILTSVFFSFSWYTAKGLCLLLGLFVVPLQRLGPVHHTSQIEDRFVRPEAVVSFTFE
jgi:hypothetical protein